MRFGNRCAHRIGVAAVFGWASCVLGLGITSLTHASTISTSSEAAVELAVVGYEGPIGLTYKFEGTDSFGLPSLTINEEFNTSAGPPPLWADVEVEVTLEATSDPNSAPEEGGIFDSIFDRFRGIFDRFDFLGGGHDPEVEDTSEPFTPHSVVVGLDKVVLNSTDLLWPDFRIELGDGLGSSFVPSTAGDGLYFVSDPAPDEVTDFYDDPPLTGGGSEADVLHWFTDGSAGPGQGDNEEGIYWFGVQVPAELFVQDPVHTQFWNARFTLRQHVARGIPEPSTLVLMSLASIGGTSSTTKKLTTSARKREARQHCHPSRRPQSEV